MNSQLALAFGAGMLAAVNPCGFAMLPAYLSYFLGLDDPTSDDRSSVLRALGVGALLTAGFVVVFGVIGIATRALALPVEAHAPRITMVIGVALVVLGGAMIAGFQPTFGLPKLEKGGRSRSSGSMFLFGVSYAIASLSCTLPIFAINVLGVFSSGTFLEGVQVFLAYALGMGLLLTALTVALALARKSLVVHLRRILPYVGRIAGVLLVVAGAFVAYWGWWEVQVLDGNLEAGGPARALLDWNGRVASWIDRTGPLRIGFVLAVFLGTALGVASLRSRTRHEGEPGGDGGNGDRAQVVDEERTTDV